MASNHTIRHAFPTALVVCVSVFFSTAVFAQPGQKGGVSRSAPPVMRMQGGNNHPAPAPNNRPAQNANHPGQNHLPQWMENHRNLTPEQQQKALEKEPGFHDLPNETQQRLRDRLTQLNNMPPEQRQRLLERNEAMTRLTAPQRQQVRGAMQQFSSLPPDRRRLVGKAFRDLREMPEPQRQAILSSDRFRGQFSDQERGTLSSLLAVEPYIPVQKSADNQEAGK
ncbi:DUF3106 domain-containing protein [Edaphobacter flagellatus]|uniref:DUF3106 domain-containing protein n=1 Tax=Edaphobacter flagellatus TaxID=1933044 RepID=UPI0021B29130|nr:DUF3106 domain-containing protein [Edaphobacter flagellatus]